MYNKSDSNFQIFHWVKFTLKQLFSWKMFLKWDRPSTSLCYTSLFSGCWNIAFGGELATLYIRGQTALGLVAAVFEASPRFHSAESINGIGLTDYMCNYVCLYTRNFFCIFVWFCSFLKPPQTSMSTLPFNKGPKYQKCLQQTDRPTNSWGGWKSSDERNTVFLK